MINLVKELTFKVLTLIPDDVILEFPILDLRRPYGQGIEGFIVVNTSCQYLPFK